MNESRLKFGDLVSAGALEFGDGYRTKRSEHGLPGYRIIRVADVLDNVVQVDGPDFVSEQHLRAIGSKIGQPGDILLTTKGTVGRVAVMPLTEELVVYSPQLCYFRVIERSIINPQFLRYWFSSQEFWNQANYRMNNTDMAAYINLADIRSLEITLPPISEQQVIAEVLGALDDKIAVNTKLANTADELAVALTTQSIASGTDVLLTDLADVTMGSSPLGTSLNEDGEGTVFYQGIRDFGLRYPERRVWTTAPSRMALVMDTLLSVRAPVGSANIAPEEICIGRGLASIRSKIGTPYTLFHAVRSSHIWHQFNSEGTVFGSINRKQLESVRLDWVNSQDLQEHEANLTALEEVIRTASSAIGTLTSTRDALLPQLMSGKLRVKEAEELVAAAI